MPEVSRFFGLVILMFYDDHQPPHFHVRYAGHRVQIAIDPLALLAGRLPPRGLAMAMEWAAQHQQELRENWELARQHAPLRVIPPLE